MLKHFKTLVVILNKQFSLIVGTLHYMLLFVTLWSHSLVILLNKDFFDWHVFCYSLRVLSFNGLMITVFKCSDPTVKQTWYSLFSFSVSILIGSIPHGGPIELFLVPASAP